MLRVTVVSAKNLVDADWIGKSDPYCVIEVPHKANTKVQTSVVNNNLNPVWHQTLEVKGYQPGDPLLFTVMDKDKFGKDAFLGSVSVQAAEFYPQGLSKALPLAMARPKTQSMLTVQIHPAGAGVQPGIPAEISGAYHSPVPVHRPSVAQPIGAISAPAAFMGASSMGGSSLRIN